MIEWLIDNKNLFIGAAALAFPLAWIDWRLRIQKRKLAQQQHSAQNSKRTAGTRKKA